MEMINKEKLIELSNRYPKDVKLYNQDIIKLMKLPGQIPGDFDPQLLEFLKLTNGAHILDYRFYGYKNIEFTPSLHQNMRDKWYEWQHIAGTIIPFVGSSSSFGFGYLEKLPFQGSHPIVYFSEFPEDTTIVGSGFNIFFNIFINYVELSLIQGDNIEVDIDEWPFNTEKLCHLDPYFAEIINSSKVINMIDSIRRS